MCLLSKHTSFVLQSAAKLDFLDPVLATAYDIQDQVHSDQVIKNVPNNLALVYSLFADLGPNVLVEIKLIDFLVFIKEIKGAFDEIKQESRQFRQAFSREL